MSTYGPLVSIITINFNNAQNLEFTIKSVINQSYKKIEYIVIDGCSKDNSLEVIRNNSKYITNFISEKDKGIYDAMNKGIDLINGDWVIFLNSGDIFYDNDILKNIFYETTNFNADIIYGDVIAIDKINNIERLIKSQNINLIRLKMPFSHQSLFIKADLVNKIKFDLNYNICADYNMILNLYKAGFQFLKLNYTISKIEIGGISYSNSKSLKQKYLIYKNIYGIDMYFFINLFNYGIACIKDIIHSVIGNKNMSKLRIIKWKLLSLTK